MNISEHSFWVAKDGTEVEVLTTCNDDYLIEMTHPDKEVEMRTINKEYVEKAVKTGTLTPKVIDKWIIRRTLDDKYYKGSNIWTDDWKEAVIFSNEKVDRCIAAFERHGYPVKKIVR